MANGIHFIIRSNTRWLKEANIAGEYKEHDKVKNILITNNMQKKKEWLRAGLKTVFCGSGIAATLSSVL
ncbi:hypothetical protein ISU90_17855 [Leptospira borgpetersenii serovar Balcanica]|nr:hypothetical protein [Leptospira borgpetersenii serovar Balcanica]